MPVSTGKYLKLGGPWALCYYGTHKNQVVISSAGNNPGSQAMLCDDSSVPAELVAALRKRMYALRPALERIASEGGSNASPEARDPASIQPVAVGSEGPPELTTLGLSSYRSRSCLE